MWQLVKLYNPVDPALALLSISPREMDAYIHKKTLTGMLWAAAATGVEKMETYGLLAHE